MEANHKATFFRSSIFKLIVFAATLSVVAYFISDKLIFGARWSSGLHLAGVDNFLAGGTFYPESAESITAGSSYFPGVMMLALVFRLLFGYYADTVFIIFGAVSWMLTAYGFASLITKDKDNRFWLFVLATWFLVFQFPAARHYLLEVHPDIPSLMCFVGGILLLPEEKTQNRWLHYSIVTILFFLSGLFKQNAAFLYIGLGLYVLLCKKVSLKNKISIITCEAVAGIALIITVLSIDGCWINCVTVNAGHHYMNWRWILFYIQNVFKYDTIFIVLCIYFLYLLIKKKVTLSLKEEMWLCASVAWTLFCLFGSIKKGADDGNMEAGIISLMPFVLYAAKRLIQNINLKISSSKVKNLLTSTNTAYVICGVSVLTIVALVVPISKNLELYRNRLVAQQEFSEWISQKFEGKNIAYNTCVYEFLNNANLVKKSDINTIEVWQWAGLVDDESVDKMAKEEKWEIIMTLRDIDGKYWPKTFDRFELIDDSSYPSISDYMPSKVDLYILKDCTN